MNIYLNNYTKLILCLPRKGNSMGPEAASSTLGLSRDFPSWMSCTQHLQQSSSQEALPMTVLPHHSLTSVRSIALSKLRWLHSKLASRTGPGTECLSLTFTSLQIGASERQTQNLGKTHSTVLPSASTSARDVLGLPGDFSLSWGHLD